MSDLLTVKGLKELRGTDRAIALWRRMEEVRIERERAGVAVDKSVLQHRRAVRHFDMCDKEYKRVQGLCTDGAIEQRLVDESLLALQLAEDNIAIANNIIKGERLRLQAAVVAEIAARGIYSAVRETLSEDEMTLMDRLTSSFASYTFC